MPGRWRMPPWPGSTPPTGMHSAIWPPGSSCWRPGSTQWASRSPTSRYPRRTRASGRSPSAPGCTRVTPSRRSSSANWAGDWPPCPTAAPAVSCCRGVSTASTCSGRSGWTTRRCGSPRRAVPSCSWSPTNRRGTGHYPCRRGISCRDAPSIPRPGCSCSAELGPPIRCGTDRCREPCMRWWPGWNDDRRRPMKGIHQFVPMLHRHDAVGEHTRSLRDLLVAAGVPSHIYSEIPDPATAGETRPYLDYESEAEAGDVLAPGAALGIAVSPFDADELGAAGCSRTTVIPVVNVQVPPVEPDRATLDRLRERWSDRGGAWLSVGRLAPNKAHQQAIAALFVARATSDPGAHLALVGSPSEPAYAAALRRYASSLGLADAVEFVSGVSDAELAAHYRAADVLVMLSEHEGFGVPLVEAMGHGLPILAFRAGAVPETLGDAGILLDHKGPRRVAEAACELTSDSGERDRLVEAGRVRLRALDLGGAGKLLVEAVQGVSASGGTGP